LGALWDLSMDWLIFFVGMLISSATPLPLGIGEIGLFLAGGLDNWVLVGLVASVATTLGELTTFYLGKGAERLGDRWKGKRYDRMTLWFEKRGFLTLWLFSFTPLPMDFAGFLAGSVDYPVKRFLLAVYLGRLPRCLLIALAGSLGWEIVKAWV